MKWKALAGILLHSWVASHRGIELPQRLASRLVDLRPAHLRECQTVGWPLFQAAAREYAEEVRQGRFPAAEHTYSR